MEGKVAIPERFDIWQQDLSKPYIALQYLGFVKTQAEAKEMLKAFALCDKSAVESGLRAYFFTCGKLRDGDGK